MSVLDADFEKQAMLWYSEIDSDNSDIEADENVYLESDHESASEQEASDDEQDSLPRDNENDNIEISSDSDTSDSSEFEARNAGQKKLSSVRKNVAYTVSTNENKHKNRVQNLTCRFFYFFTLEFSFIYFDFV